MANLQRQLRNDKNLGRFIMRDAMPTGKHLGVGSYGSVQEVKVGGLVCAGKTIHETLLEEENFGAGNIAQKYVEECKLMANLRHPNVTLFLGLCFLPPATLPVLVMEKLEGSLDDLLESAPNIPLALKRSILEDVARGLLYLHQRDPPIIHRDLTAKNVLLTSSFTAKLTDLGNSRIINLQSGKLAKTLSQLPGTLVYMPPEALNVTSRYGPSLDIFSFGHLGLYALLQVFPGDLLEPTFSDSGNLMVHSEVERRGVYFEQLQSMLPRGEQHPFIQLVKQCLHNVPAERPTTEMLSRTLEEMRGEIDGPYGSYDVMKLDLMRQVAMMKTLRQSECELRRKDAEIKRLQQELETERADFEERLRAQTAEMKRESDRVRHANEETICRLKEQLRQLKTKSESQVQCCHKTIEKGEISIIGDLGVGSYTTVKEGIYKSRGGELEVKCAIKYLNQDRLREVIQRLEFEDLRYGEEQVEDLKPKFTVAEFFREADILAKLNHPNIIKLYGIMMDPACLLIEFAFLKVLNTYLRRHPSFPVLKIMNMMVQVAQGMDYLEHMKVIHKDLATRNILVMDEENVKIGDFASACVIDSDSNSDSEHAAGRPGIWPLEWYAPECFYFAKFDSKSDVWSYGITVWEAFSYGSKPYSGMKEQDIMFMLERNERLSCPEKCPQSVYDIMLKCWSWKAEDRPTFSTLMKQMYTFLFILRQHVQAQHPPPLPPKPKPKPVSRPKIQ